MGASLRQLFGKSLIGRIRSACAAAYAMDLRSLALMRIGVGLLLLVDLFQRSFHLTEHYTDDGVLRRSGWLDIKSGSVDFSFHLFSGSTTGQALLFSIAAVFALALLLGWRTRLMSFLSWVLLLSLQNRNPVLLNGGDVLLRLMLFWGMFLPWGRRYSLDSAKSTLDAPGRNTHYDIPVAAYIVQVACLYVFAVILKTGGTWRESFDAVYYALSLDYFRIFLGDLLLQLDFIHRPMTIATFFIEAAIPALLLVPIWVSRFRALAIGLVFMIHIGFALSLRIGLFPWINMVSVLAFLPSGFYSLPVWRRIEGAVNRFSGRFRFFVTWAGSIDRWRVSPRVSHFIIQGGAAFFLLLVLFWNIETVTRHRFLPGPVKSLGRALRLDQKWNMFAPNPNRWDMWIEIEAMHEDGSTFDPFRSNDTQTRKPAWEPPPNPHQDYPSYRHRKFYKNLTQNNNKEYRLWYARYLCRKWNTPGQTSRMPASRRALEIEPLKSFKIYAMERKNLPGGKHGKVRKRLLWRHVCY